MRRPFFVHVIILKLDIETSRSKLLSCFHHYFSNTVYYLWLDVLIHVAGFWHLARILPIPSSDIQPINTSLISSFRSDTLSLAYREAEEADYTDDDFEAQPANAPATTNVSTEKLDFDAVMAKYLAARDRGMDQQEIAREVFKVS